ncbi:MAG: VWA domain-containing protein, partial [Acidobacteriota bacterium]
MPAEHMIQTKRFPAVKAPRRPLMGGLVAALALGGAVSALGTQDAVFRTSVDLVTVDASVIGRDGGPVADLVADDFTVDVDGRPRRLVSAQFIAQPAPGSRPAPLQAAHFTSNEHLDAGRTVVIAVDEAHIRRLEGRPALEAAATFLDRLDGSDRVAVTGLSRVGVVEFSRDRAALKRRLATLVGQTDPVFLQFNIGLLEAVEVADGSRTRLADVVQRECGRSLTEYISLARATDDAAGRDACPEQVEQEARAMAQHARTQATISMSALGALVSSLKTLEGPKTVILLSEGMVLDPRLVDVSELAASAKDARVTIYGLQMEIPTFEASQDRISPSFPRDLQMRGDGLERVVGATRGAVFRLNGGDPRPFERIATEISGYYLLAFEATDADRDGQLHRIKVGVSRRGVLIRARPAFRMAPVVRSSSARQADLVDLLRGGSGGSELPVRVATYTYLEPDSARLRVVVSVETGVPDGAASQVLLGYVLTDGAGVIAASGAHQTPAGRHAFSTVVPAGSYTLRVGGIDPLGRRGLVQRSFAAAVDRLSAVRVSDLILAPVPVPATAVLQPLVDRVTDPRVATYVEVHAGDADLTGAHVTFEVSASSQAG